MSTKLPLDSIFHGDCADVLRQFPDESINLCLTSPPYDNLRDYHGFTFDIDRVTPELFRVMKKGGVVVWVIDDGTHKRARTGSSIRHAVSFFNAGFSEHDWMIYKKKGIRYPDKSRYYNVFEHMFLFSKGFPKTINQIEDRRNESAGKKKKYSRREKNGSVTRNDKVVVMKEFGVRTNVWEYSTGSNSNAPDKPAYKHSAIMPLGLAEDHITSWTTECSFLESGRAIHCPVSCPCFLHTDDMLLVLGEACEFPSAWTLGLHYLEVAGTNLIQQILYIFRIHLWQHERRLHQS
ncbi:MAG TPA: site-specific DNA-methyltransferase [Planctomycetaceae bacterium]|nr:restriction endonuclease [Rubinisphaera sp.]HCS50954.1 site-specific DNA-methyltransferase [Planctomycetaceae bacterium]